MVLSARHRTANNVATYQQDAATRWELNNLERNNTANRCGPMKSRHLVKHLHGTAITPSTPYQKDLPQLVDWWYDTCLGLKDVPFSEPISILNLALQDRSSSPCSTVDFNTVQRSISAHISDPGIVRTLMSQVQRLTYNHSTRENQDLIRRLASYQNPVPGPSMRQVLDERASTTSPVRVPGTGSPVPAPIAVSPARTTGTRSPVRTSRTSNTGGIALCTQGFKGLGDTRAKLKFIQGVFKEFRAKTGGKKELLTPASKKWCNRYLKIVLCLEGHLQGDVDLFVEQYNCPKDFPSIKWRCTCQRGAST